VAAPAVRLVSRLHVHSSEAILVATEAISKALHRPAVDFR
jgi:hypothetical protein